MPIKQSSPWPSPLAVPWLQGTMVGACTSGRVNCHNGTESVTKKAGESTPSTTMSVTSSHCKGHFRTKTLKGKSVGYKLLLLMWTELSNKISEHCTRQRAPTMLRSHDDVIKWKHFPCYWPFMRIHRSAVNSPHKGKWRVALMFSLIYAWTNGWVKNWYPVIWDGLHYDVTVMI